MHSREGADEDGVGVRQGHHEESDGGGPAVESDLSLAEVDLGFARAVDQGDENHDGTKPPGGNGFLDDGQAAGVAVLVAEPLEDAASRVPLLPRGLLVVLEELVDEGKERSEFGPGAWDRTAVAGRFSVLKELLERVPVDVVLAAGGAFAQAVDQDATANLGPAFHVGVRP